MILKPFGHHGYLLKYAQTDTLAPSTIALYKFLLVYGGTEHYLYVRGLVKPHEDDEPGTISPRFFRGMPGGPNVHTYHYSKHE